MVVRVASRLLLFSILGLVVPLDAFGTLSIHKLTSSISAGFRQRIEADPSFPAKSAAELLLAAGTQLSAEWNRRGDFLLLELDFVVAGVITAMVGKYYTMWRVAPTLNDDRLGSAHPADTTIFGVPVPNNVFQATLVDRVTEPSIQQRFLSFFAPMSSLFQAGVVASAIGYGLTAGLIALRSYLIPSYVAVTRSVNIVHASLYTGAFMAFVSNLRYQILQGVIEPQFIDKLRKYPLFQASLIFIFRMANGFLGSVLAITGMRMLGLQTRK